MKNEELKIERNKMCKLFLGRDNFYFLIQRPFYALLVFVPKFLVSIALG